MPGGEVHHWPICAVCSELFQEPTVVEEYEIPQDDFKGETNVMGEFRPTSFVVIARCSHGKGFKPGTVKEQKCKIHVPEWWGPAHQDDAIRSLIFFAPGEGAPNHNLVTQVN